MSLPFRIPVANLLRAPGSSRRVSVSAPLEGVAALAVKPPAVEAITVVGRLDALVDGLWFEGTVTGVYHLECVRCLTAVDVPFDAPFGEHFAADIPPGSEDGYPLRGEEIDLEPLVRDNVILGLPARPLCRVSCAGLCARCGADLNEGPCSCVEESGHPALQVLARLFSDR